LSKNEIKYYCNQRFGELCYIFSGWQPKGGFSSFKQNCSKALESFAAFPLEGSQKVALRASNDTF